MVDLQTARMVSLSCLPEPRACSLALLFIASPLVCITMTFVVVIIGIDSEGVQQARLLQ
jgi:hypothetical protein